jgi:hypothetical protein
MVVEHHREGVELPLVELTDLGDPLLFAPGEEYGVDRVVILLQALGMSPRARQCTRYWVVRSTRGDRLTLLTMRIVIGKPHRKVVVCIQIWGN